MVLFDPDKPWEVTDVSESPGSKLPRKEANTSNQGSILFMYFFVSQNEMIVHW